MDGWMDIFIDRWMDGYHIDRWMVDIFIDGWMDGYHIDGWMDG